MSKIIGIDLGTTFSAAALVGEGTPHIISYNEERIMPSVVGFTPQKNLLVGTPALNQYVLYPEQTIRSIKRKMGQEVQVQLGDTNYTPPQISALILRELKRRVESQLGESVTRAVITVPAYFSDAARQATREAGEIAGFIVERIINEPTAAALAYGLDQSDDHQLVAVYDLGGGTFDVSIIELDQGVVEVRASHGNTQLGGDDFDQLLVDFLAERFKEEHGGIDPRTDRKALARLTRAAEHAKITLSSQPFARLREEFLMAALDGRPLHLDTEISRTEFESLITDLLEGTLESLDAALRDAGISSIELNRILFVGGSTRIPLVWEMVNQYTGIEPEVVINPDEAVALGAAVQAAIIAGEPLEAILVDVTPHSLGIEVASQEFGRIVPDHYSIIVQRNTTIPTTRSEVYTALFVDQDSIRLKIYQGENPRASRNTLLGDFLFEELRSEAPGLPPRITVRFDFDIDGILHVSATDRGSGKQTRTSVRAARVQLTPAEISSAQQNLAELELAEEDWEDLENELLEIEEEAGEDEVETLAPPHRLETLGALSRARRLIEKGGPDIEKLKKSVAALETALATGDEASSQAFTEELMDLLYDLEEE